jgi:hypothetical protein
VRPPRREGGGVGENRRPRGLLERIERVDVVAAGGSEGGTIGGGLDGVGVVILLGGVRMAVRMRVPLVVLREQIVRRQALGFQVDVGPPAARVLVGELEGTRQAGGHDERGRAQPRPDAK